MPVSSRTALFALIAAGTVGFAADGATSAAAFPAAALVPATASTEAQAAIPIGYRGRRTSRVYGYAYRAPAPVYRPRVYGYYAERPVVVYRPPIYGYYAEPPVAVYRPPVYGYYVERPVTVYRPPVYGYYAERRVPAYGPRVYGFTATVPLRTDCGTLRYWDGGRCVDARFLPPPR